MTQPRSTEARRKTRAGLVSVRIGATRIGGNPHAFWVPVEVAQKIERLCEATPQAAAGTGVNDAQEIAAADIETARALSR